MKANFKIGCQIYTHKHIHIHIHIVNDVRQEPVRQMGW